MPFIMSVPEATEILREAGHRFYQKNWMLGTSGNLSIRLSDREEPLCYLITVSGCDKGALTPDDFVRLGTALEPTGLDATDKKSSAETLLHEAIYKTCPEANAVYHVHTVAAAFLSQPARLQQGGISFSGLEMLKGLGANTHETQLTLPVVENSQDMEALSQKLPSLLNPEVPGILLQGHGLYTWGKTPFEAKRHVEIWEYLFQYKVMEQMVKPY